MKHARAFAVSSLNPVRALVKNTAARSGAVRGALYMTGAALCFAFMNSLVRYCSQTIPPLEIAFFRNLFAFAFMTPLLMHQGRAVLRTRHLGWHMVRAVTGIFAMGLWFTSVSIVPLPEAVALNFTLPLFVILGAAFILKEKVGMHRWAATAVGFFGMLVILRPGLQEVTPIMTLPILAAVFMASGIIILKHVSPDDRASTSVLYMNLLLTPLSLIPALFVWRWPDLWTLAILALLGFFAMFAHWMLARASAITDASVIMPFDYLRLPFIAVFAYFFFAQVADAWTWIGAGIIAGAALYIARREARARKLGVLNETAVAASVRARTEA